jgi:peptidoglycan hydrolase CwlO-like protein
VTIWETVIAELRLLAGRHDDLHSKVDQILAKENILSDQQAELDADTQQLTTVVSAINDSVQTASAEVAALQQAIANGTPPAELDFTGLEAALGDAQTAANGVAGVATAAAPPAPPAS